ncbi:MAG TPA: excinuclease ABC subunit B [Chloroflexi bacterium]|nr:excinuclease ABC subunit B [Chloroflexota bacterium]|tara:strand:+ start:835 stop:2880 length:2046 start_codon:yes stop_codon:yes gene_type:complete
MPEFKVTAPYQPTGDQPEAIRDLVKGLDTGLAHQVLHGATGTGKTYTIANVIEKTQKSTLVLAHNKTLAAQLYAEFKEFFPHNAVEYFVSYYDYYQPEAYVPRQDLYVEKETSINDQIDQMRLSATTSLMSRSDVIIVGSVSSIYGLGSPISYGKVVIDIKLNTTIRRKNLLRQLVEIQYNRNDIALKPGTFAVRGDTIEILPPYAKHSYRIDLFGDEIERILEVNTITGEVHSIHDAIKIFPARHFIAEEEKLQMALKDIENELQERIAYFKTEERYLEAQRIEQRTQYDLEMLREVGSCSGIENYSRPLDQRPPGSPPWTLIDYFPADFLLVIDESHMTIPQIRGMYAGDLSRKSVLVDYGFRLPSALDNRPLNFNEFQERIGQTIYTSATPGPYELEQASCIIQQVIRPTGLLDPTIEVRPIKGQVDDLVEEIRLCTLNGERAIVTTLTKRMAEDLSAYLAELNIKVQYLHSEIDALERVEILRELRLGVYDVVVGINLLREGLDLPEVSLVSILDADKQGFLRSATALIQTIGRAARHSKGRVIMYAAKHTDAMRHAIDETNRRRSIQSDYNSKHNIKPTSIVKSIRDITDQLAAKQTDDTAERIETIQDMTSDEIISVISETETNMYKAADDMEFEKAALLRDTLYDLRKILTDKISSNPEIDLPRVLAGEITKTS